MDPSWIAGSAIETVLIVAGLGFHFLTRNRRSGAADPTPADGDDLQEMKVENGPSATTTELATHRDDTEHIPFTRSVSAEPGHEFEVFLSFRGKEIRKNFADCLYHKLIGLGVRTFRDSEELHVGEEIGPSLMSAIKQSKICMPIFTEGYATSKWCLREVAEMVKLMKGNFSGKQVIMPIFFDVTPNDVQHQTGSYADAFTQHEKEIKPEAIKEWRDALEEVGNLKGLELSQAANGNQGEFIDLVAAEVLRKLRQAWVDMSENIVGLDDPADAVMQMLELGLNDIRMVGISGMGGIGKTTLATYVYNKIASDFQCCSFLSDVRETYSKPGGCLELQSKLVDDILGKQTYRLTSTAEAINVLKNRVRGKKALILIDDVDNINQLNALAAEPDWFGSGSRILVTTREKKVLNQFPWSSTYVLKRLDEDLALELLCKYAFRDDSPSPEFADLSKEIVRVTGGLPLALVVIGSSLYASHGKKGVWEDTVEQLKGRLDTNVLEKLRISYDALNAEQKKIFLDIACFFIGWDYEHVIPMWHDCKFYPRLGIEVLQLKCLINIGDDNELQMHDQLRDLGRYVVEQESSEEPEQRSRLWKSKEAIDVLKNRQGTRKIEGVAIWLEGEAVTFSENCFQNLSGLRTLSLIGDVKLDGDYQHLLPNLRLLRWSTESNHPPNLTLNNLVVLNLSHSRIDEDWIAWNSIKMEKLKVLDLTACHRLRRISGFSAFPNLERLVLEDCIGLDSIDPSIELLKNLNFLSLRCSYRLEKLPDQLGYLEALSVLIVDYTFVEVIPISARMKKLEFLSANYCPCLKSIPNSVGSLQNLKRLSLECCSSLSQLHGIRELGSLEQLTITHSDAIEELPELSKLQSLEYLNISNCKKLNRLDGLEELGSLKDLDISYCEEIEKLPNLSKLQSLQRLNICGFKGQFHLDAIGELVSLQTLIVRDCKAIEKLPELSKLQSLRQLYMSGCGRLIQLDGLRELRSLQHLDMSGCQRLFHLDAIGELVSLQTLIVRDCKAIEKLPELSKLQSLRQLYMSGCGRLIQLDGLRELRSLQHLDMSGCQRLFHLDAIGELVSLQTLIVRDCKAIEKLPELSKLQSLRQLDMSHCERLIQLDGLRELGSLEHLDMRGCKSLFHLDAIGELISLQTLEMGYCETIEKLPELSKLQSLQQLGMRRCERLIQLDGLRELGSLQHLDMSGCKRLIRLDGIGKLVSLESLDISDCKAIEKLPELSKLQSLQQLKMSRCERLIQLDGLRELGSLKHLDMSGCKRLIRLDGIGELVSLETLDIRNGKAVEKLLELSKLQSLHRLDVNGSQAIEKLPRLSKHYNLSVLYMRGCSKLHQLDGVGELRSLTELDISGCTSIENITDLAKLQKLKILKVTACKKLRHLEGLEGLNLLTELGMSGCKAIEQLPDLSQLHGLWDLGMDRCKKLHRLDEVGLEELKNLWGLRISGCKRIEKLPNLSKLQSLQRLDIKACAKLRRLEGLEELKLLVELDISGCRALEKLPDLSKCRSLEQLKMDGCKNIREVRGLENLINLRVLRIPGCELLDLQDLSHQSDLNIRK